MLRSGSALVIALMLPLESCASQGTPTTPGGVPSGAVAVEFEPVAEVSRARMEGPQEPTRSVVRDEQSWLAFWGSLTGAVSPAPEPPSIDFTGDMVLVAAIGRRTTGGHTVSVEGVYSSDDVLFVDVLERSPGLGCFSTQVMTAPVAAVRMRVHDGSVRFLVREESGPCD